jgi:predicted MFS family arabinose efflux permease
MSVFGLAQAAALTVGPGLGRALLGALGYPGLFVASGCTAFAAFLCVLALPASAPPKPRHDVARRSTPWTLLGTAAAPAAVQFTASIAYGTIISFIAVVARDRGLEVVGAFFALLALSSFGVRLAVGRAYDAWGAGRVLTPLFLVLATGMALLAVASGSALFLTGAVLAGLGIGGTHTTLISAVVDRSPPERRASGVAGFAACWELGVGGGAVVAGRLADSAGFETVFLGVAALPVLGLGGLRLLRGREEPRPEGE